MSYKRIILSIIIACGTFTAQAQYNVDRLLIGGRYALHYEDYVLSIQYFNQAISQKPYLWEPWQLRAIAKYYLDDWQGSESDATEAIERNPYITELYDLRGISRIRLENYEGALSDYSQAIKLAPNNRNYRYNKAACYMEIKNYEKAHEELDTLISRWKTYAPPYLMKAQALMQQSDTTEAVKWIDKSLEIDAYNADAWRVRGYIALQKEQWEKADTFFTKSLHLKSRDAHSLLNRGLVRLRLNNLRGAMEDYNAALDVDPNNFLAHYNRGLLRQQVGDDNRAIEDFDYVLELEPGNVMALFNRATLLDRTGNLRAAIRDYTLVINQFPNFWTGLQYRAACYRKLGMIAKAEKDEFRILKAQMDKHLGIQNRWSRKKLSAMRKLNDIDLEKYDNLVVEDESITEQDYKSEYRGKIQNRQTTEQYQPFIALTMNGSRAGLVSYTPFDRKADAFIEQMRRLSGKTSILPVLGGIGEGTGLPTFETVDTLTSIINVTRDSQIATQYLLLRAVAYCTAQNYDEAMKDINTVLQIQPESFVALWQRAVCAAMMADYEHGTKTDSDLRSAGVIADFKRLEEMDKDNALVLYCHGTFCARNNDNNNAIELLSKALSIDPNIPQAYYNRGLAYLHNGDVTKAKADFSKAGERGLYSAYSLMKGSSKKKK